MAPTFGLPWAIESLFGVRNLKKWGEVIGGVMHQNGGYLLVEWAV
jgi:hypothetical protein